MTTKMRVIVYLLMVIVTISCSVSPSEINSSLIGEYKINGFNMSESIALLETNQFIYHRGVWSCVGGGSECRFGGHYEVKDNKVLLRPEYIVQIDQYGFWGNISTEKDSTRYYSSDSTYLTTEYQIVIWDSATYLLTEDPRAHWGSKDENDFEHFSNYYNSGLEPMSNGFYFVRRRSGHVPASKLDLSRLPEKYRDRFLEQPIVADILDIKKDKPRVNGDTLGLNRFKLNRGKKDGVMEKMEFYGDDGCCTIEIIEVEENVSFGKLRYCYDYLADCGIGSRVTTYMEREKGKLASAH